MTRVEQIIKDVEEEYCRKVDSNFDQQSLCDGDTCRSSECSCWDDLYAEVAEHLVDLDFKEKYAEYKPIYDGEVTAGIHQPPHEG